VAPTVHLHTHSSIPRWESTVEALCQAVRAQARIRWPHRPNGLYGIGSSKSHERRTQAYPGADIHQGHRAVLLARTVRLCERVSYSFA
jgi:hypothetical protein